MKCLRLTLSLAAALAAVTTQSPAAPPAAEVYPAAILPFAERGIGVKDLRPQGHADPLRRAGGQARAVAGRPRGDGQDDSGARA